MTCADRLEDDRDPCPRCPTVDPFFATRTASQGKQRGRQLAHDGVEVGVPCSVSVFWRVLVRVCIKIRSAAAASDAALLLFGGFAAP